MSAVTDGWASIEDVEEELGMELGERRVRKDGDGVGVPLITPRDPIPRLRDNLLLGRKERKHPERLPVFVVVKDTFPE